MKLTIILNKDDEFLESIIPKYGKNEPIDREEALKLKIFCSKFLHKPNETKTVYRLTEKVIKNSKEVNMLLNFIEKNLFS